MQNEIEIRKINSFLNMAGPLILEFIEAILCLLGLEVKREGKGLESAFVIKHNDSDIKFFVHNLLLEIATVDRDEQILRFDEGLYDFGFFMAKTMRLIESKLVILEHLVSEGDVEKAIKNIASESSRYERIRIWKFDQKPT